MKLAVHCANLSWPGGPAALGPTLAEVARTADEGVLVVDLGDRLHLRPPVGIELQVDEHRVHLVSRRL